MPGDYSSLTDMVQGERAWATAQELSRVVKLLNALIENKQQAARGLGLVEAPDVEELMDLGFKDISWGDIVLVAAPAILEEARELVRE